MLRRIVFLTLLSACCVLADMGCEDIRKTNKTQHYDVKLKYNAQPDNQTGKYPNGTRVRATCPIGNRPIGAQGTVCRGNQWIPTLGRCPYRCHVNDIIKKGYHNTTHPKDPQPRLQWRFSGTVTKFLCQRSLSTLGWDTWKCYDGKWSAADYDYCPWI